MRLVLRIGGSVVASPMNPILINDYGNLLVDVKRKGHEIAVVVGGGVIARELISVAKDLGLQEEAQDEIAIAASRILAQLFLLKLRDSSCRTISLTIEDAVKCLREGKIAVMGGLRPGMTTDAVAALIAEEADAELLVKATNQDGIYNKDPHKYSDARQLKEVTIEYLIDEYGTKWTSAGNNIVIDGPSLNIIKRSKIPVVVVNGKRINQLEKAFRNQQFDGTKIKI